MSEHSGRWLHKGSDPPKMIPMRISVAQGRAQFAYRIWLDHVSDCEAECRTEGVDCATAKELRRALRDARGQATP